MAHSSVSPFHGSAPARAPARKLRTTLIIHGRGHVASDPAIRERVFNLAPEVEQNHDPGRKGAALIIDVASLQGTTVRGLVRVASA